MNTVMREAFMRMQFKTSHMDSPALQAIIKVGQTKAGVRREDKGWSTNLSFRTYSKLKADGVLA